MAGFSIAMDPLPPPGGADVTVPMAGAYVGDGMPPSHSKTGSENTEVGICRDGSAAARVLGGSKRGGTEQGGWVRQGRKVTDICTWVQCFGTYVAVLVPAEPLVVLELMVCMGITVRCRRTTRDSDGYGTTQPSEDRLHCLGI